ncbi:shikimate kinase [Ferroacidibacillus organovorans]|uniref:Shikimate kinase n=1 Tax=Ferroacidibacillus organovorans TaxID=1765683 RepID=A0A1V4EU32_9BACL|nr:shikimate kinase [Ferroacidibacillus organovorans]OPG16445.1 hypothetical protein B2M26_06090 [Ferroacidibacillus organovorans]
MWISLIGFTGSGKSTVGRALAYSYGLLCYDLDAWIERKEGERISTLFARYGETHFRKLEHETLTDLLNHYPPGVLVTGGGAILMEANRLQMREKSFVVSLHVPLAIVRERLRNDRQRPLLQGDNFDERLNSLFYEREKQYQFSHFLLNRIDIEHDIHKIYGSFLDHVVQIR